MNKSDFPIFKTHPQLVYLDNASTSQKPQVVIDSIADFYTKSNANIHRGIYQLAEEATNKYNYARATTANFLGADFEEIIFTSGTTESINLIAQMILLHNSNTKAKKSILISEMEHHSNLIPWQKVAKRLNWDLEYIKVQKDFTLDYADFEKKLTNTTAVLAITHMSNVLGTINDIETMCDYAKDINPNITTIIDGAQYIPHYKIDIGKQKNIDFYCFSGHKILGPTGIGVMYGKKEILETLEPAKFGGGMISRVEKTTSTWTILPEKFEAGTPNIASAIGLGVAINYIENLDQNKLETHMTKIADYTYTQLSSLPEITLFHSVQDREPFTASTQTSTKYANHSGAVYSFSVKNIHPHDIAQILDRDNIAIRAGHHCTQVLHKETLSITATNRVSLYFYNQTEDIDKLVSSIKKIITKFR